MALPSTATHQIRTTGNDLNGIFFNAARGGVDYSQSDTPIISITDLSSNGSTSVFSASNLFTSQMVGNGLSIAGTVYEIVTVNSANQVTLDRVATTASNQSARVGGAAATPGKVSGLLVTGNVVWQKAGNYTLTTTTSNISGGVVNIGVGQIYWSGFLNTPGDDLGRAVILAGANSTTIFQTASGQTTHQTRFMEFDGNGFTSVTGFTCWNLGRGMIYRCKAIRCNTGININSPHMTAEQCEATICGTAGFNVNGRLRASWSHHNTLDGIAISAAGGSCVDVISNHNGRYGFHFANLINEVRNCTAYGNTNHGFFTNDVSAGSSDSPVSNCVSYANGGWGYFILVNTRVTQSHLFQNNAAGANTSGDYTMSSGTLQTGQIKDFVTLTAVPFAAPTVTANTLAEAITNFTPNTTTGGGALIRAVGVNKRDLGAVQGSSGSGGGGSTSVNSIFDGGVF